MPGSDFVAGGVPHRQAITVSAARATTSRGRQSGNEELSAGEAKVVGVCIGDDLHLLTGSSNMRGAFGAVRQEEMNSCNDWFLRE